MQHNKIEQLKNLFAKFSIDAYLVPSGDEFLSEYTPNYLNRLLWLTEFESSNALALITKNENYIFTDGRYLEAAEKKFGEDYIIKDLFQESIWDFIDAKQIIVGLAPELFTKNDKMRNIKFVPELVDFIWQRNKFNSSAEYFYYDEQYSGASFAQKAAKICHKMSELGADYLVITQPDMICWLTNLRGQDQEYTPLMLAYAILAKDGQIEIFLYNEEAKKPDIKGIEYKNFSSFTHRIKELKLIMLDPNGVSLALLNIAGEYALLAPNPIIEYRAIKSQIEIENAKKIHLIDSIAMTKFLQIDFTGLTEEKVKEISYKLRSQSNLFISPSFETIAGFRGNGSVIHYHVREDTNQTIEGDGLLLIDSGGQYLGGTTDVTRTIAIGTPTDEQIFAYTTVLRAHLRLSNAKFKKGTIGKELDQLTRSVLLEQNMNYEHGTGHGVGNFLSVHETPPSINSRSSAQMKAGMIISNEPGYYKKGEFGIRIENLCLVVEIDEHTLAMENLTYVPYDEKLIDYNLLSHEEKKWLADYNEKIQSMLNKDSLS